MQHTIDLQSLNARDRLMVKPIEACVHCGFCLATCPTYQVLQEEMDSPRGRIVLMKHVLEGTLEYAQALPYIDKCLGCLACETACPSGVRYRDLVSLFRQKAKSTKREPLRQRAARGLLLQMVTQPQNLKAGMALGRLAAPFSRMLPSFLRPVLRLIPSTPGRVREIKDVIPAVGTRRARVALLLGCAQRVIDAAITEATIEVLTRNGVEVVTPSRQGCCGALAWHTGDGETARRHALANLSVFPDDVDAIVTDAAGCGSTMQEYELLLQGTAQEEPARRFAERSMDISVFLERLGIEPPPPARRAIRIAYHDACHLSHAQSVRAAPRGLLRAIGNVEILEVPDGEICCGSAGIYNVLHPGIAAALGERKAANIASTRPDLIAAGNIGCITQIRAHLLAKRDATPVLHTVQILQKAYRNEW